MKQYLRNIINLPFSVKLFLITEALFGFSIGVWNLTLNFHFKVNGLSDINIGTVVSFGLFITAVVSVFAGILSDKIGYRPIMTLGCLIQGMGMIFLALFPDNTLAYIGQFIYGFGYAFILASEFPFITGLVEERFKQLVYNLLIGTYLLAMVFGSMIGGVLPSWMHNSQNPYFLAILLSGICFILMGIGRSMLPAYRAPLKSQRSFFTIIMNKKILSYIIYGIITSTFLNMINSMLNLIFRDRYKLPDSTIGIIFSIISIVGSIAAFIVPYLAGRFKGANVAVVTMIIQSVVISCMSFAGTYVFSLFIIVRSFVGCITQGNVDSYMLQSVSEHERGAYSGVRIFGNNIGMAIGAALAGMFTMEHSYVSLFLTAGGFTIIQIFIYNLLCKKYFFNND